MAHFLGAKHYSAMSFLIEPINSGGWAITSFAKLWSSS